MIPSVRCQHERAVSGAKFCPDCASPIGVVMREPGEIRRMLHGLPTLVFRAFPHPMAQGLVLFSVGLNMLVLRWVLGELTNEELEERICSVGQSGQEKED